MTKWNSNDFIDAFASPTEAEGAPGTGPGSGCQHPTCSGDLKDKSVLVYRGPKVNVSPERVRIQYSDG